MAAGGSHDLGAPAAEVADAQAAEQVGERAPLGLLDGGQQVAHREIGEPLEPDEVVVAE